MYDCLVALDDCLLLYVEYVIINESDYLYIIICD